MGLGEELRIIKTEDVDTAFDALYPPGEETSGKDEQQFIHNELVQTWQRYPSLMTIYARTNDIVERYREAGIFSDEKIQGILIGSIVVQQVLFNLAESEVPDTPPSDLGGS